MSVVCRFAVTSEMVEPFLEGMTLDEAMQSKKLYLIDLTYLVSIQCTDDRKVRLLTNTFPSSPSLFFPFSLYLSLLPPCLSLSLSPHLPPQSSTFVPISCALCPVPCARCPVPCALCPVPCALSPVPCLSLSILSQHLSPPFISTPL